MSPIVCVSVSSGRLLQWSGWESGWQGGSVTPALLWKEGKKVLGLCTGMEKNERTGFSIRFANRFFGIRKTGIRLVSNQILNSYDYDIEYWTNWTQSKQIK